MKEKLFIIALLFFIMKKTIYPHDVFFDNFVEEYSKIRSIRGTIIQYVYNGTAVERMSGDYSAVAEGWFRIDYTEPEKQTVIYNSKALYWFFPNRLLVFTSLKDERDSVGSGLFPGNPISQILDDVKIEYRGITFYGLLNYAHVYSINTSSDRSSVRIWFEPGRRFIVRKYIIDNSGCEIMKEIYHEHFHTGKTYIPSHIELFARSRDGIIHTRTEYKDLSVNSYTDMKIFDFVIKKNMSVRRFDDYQ